MPEEERLGMYLAIAEEATKGSHFEIGKVRRPPMH